MMDFEKSNIEKKVKTALCHEWGHVIAEYLLYGTLKHIQRIYVEDVPLGVYGHTDSFRFYTDYEVPGNPKSPLCCYQKNNSVEKEIMVLLAGKVAERVCGYSGGRFTFDSSDKMKIEELTSNRRLVTLLRAKTEELLLPTKSILEELTKKSLNEYPKERDENYEKHYTVCKDEINEWLEALLPEHLRPKEISFTKSN